MHKSSGGLGLDFVCPPGFRIQLHVTTSHSTGSPVNYVQLSEGWFRVVSPHGMVPVLRRSFSPLQIWLVDYLHLHLHVHQ